MNIFNFEPGFSINVINSTTLTFNGSLSTNISYFAPTTAVINYGLAFPSNNFNLLVTDVTISNVGGNIYITFSNKSYTTPINFVGQSSIALSLTFDSEITTGTQTYNFSGPEPGGAPCFTDNTQVLTPNGYINITQLKNNDIVLTHDNRQVPIVKIYSFNVIGNKQNNPYIIPKNSIEQNYPPEDIILSGKHLIRYQNGWIQPQSGFNGLLFKQDDSKSTIKYYHIKLPNYLTDYLVINGGCVVESFGDNIPVAIRKRKGLYQIIVK
jgi:hypothetical protein